MGRAMKDSGVEWIGEIPEEWKLLRGKTIFAQRAEKGNSISTQLLTPSQKYGVVPQTLYEALSGMKAVKLDLSVDLSGLKTVHKGDFCISLRSFQGGFEYSEYEGVVSPAYQIFYPIKEISDGYYKRLFKSVPFIEKMNSFTMSLRDGKNIAFNDFAVTLLPYPPLAEQEKISEALEKACTEIDSIIDQTRASIEEYKHLKQAVITQAVTKGVRGDRPMKESGVAWIGKVPEKWDIVNLGKHMTIESGISVGKTYETGTPLVEVPYLRVANVQGDHVDFSDIATIFVTPEEAEKYKLRAGQMLMTEGGDRDKLGRGCKWNGEIENCIHQNHVFAVQTDDGLLTDYLDYLTTSDVARTYFDITAKKTTNLACTNKTTIQRFTIPVPPIDEQGEICAFLDDKCAKLNSLIAKKEQLLTELESYKKSLIYEYVTGKKEVTS